MLNNLLSDENLEIAELQALRSRVRKAQELEAQKAVMLAIQENNEQVAHDIRSPIESINELLGQLKIGDDKLRRALGNAIQRANSVANYLLTGEMKVAGTGKDFFYDVTAVVESLAVEKRALFAGGEILINAPAHLFASSALSSNALERVLSNVIDNAILASDQIKQIKISLVRNEKAIVIDVSDKGRGISSDILGKLGQKGISLRAANKPRGSGRGVYSAKKTLSEVGGNINFESSPDRGTTVVMTLPVKAAEPIQASDLVLIDNEDLVRLTWQIKAEAAGKTCQTFSSMEEFLASADAIPKSTPLFVDSDLGDGKRGQDYAPLLREMGFQRIILATAHERLHGTTIPFIDEVIGKGFSMSDIA